MFFSLSTEGSLVDIRALHLSRTPSQRTGTRPPSCLLLDNLYGVEHMKMYPWLVHYSEPVCNFISPESGMSSFIWFSFFFGTFNSSFPFFFFLGKTQTQMFLRMWHFYKYFWLIWTCCKDCWSISSAWAFPRGGGRGAKVAPALLYFKKDNISGDF